jgi:hypothetical protein
VSCRVLAVVGVAFLAVGVGAASARVTRTDSSGTVVQDGAKVFPLVLAKGPDAGSHAPDGSDAIADVASAGITMLKIGPATVAWTSADIAEAETEDSAALASGLSTWVNLSTIAQVAPGSTGDALLTQVVSSLTGTSGGSAIAMWKGLDEPFWSGVAPAALQFVYCRATGRGDQSWCDGEPVLDANHAWVTVEAPRGTPAQLAPYAAVSDVHGVDVYPVTLADPAPDLHDVGRWTSTLASVTPTQAVWTTIQVCASGSYDSASGTHVLPTLAQERYMAYDAIINGARSLAFYGGNIPGCWTASDRAAGWNWTFWNAVLGPLVEELNAASPLAPALVDPATTQTLTADDASTQAISRAGAGDDLWVMAARAGAGSAHVTIGGLPSGISSGTVYTEGRSVPVANGSFTDDFPQWGVHVYHFVPNTPPPPTVASLAPTSGAAGIAVEITGAHLDGATRVAFGSAPAVRFTIVSGTEIDTTVPAGATTGLVTVTTPGGTASSSSPFTVTAASTGRSGGGGGGGAPNLIVTMAGSTALIQPGDEAEISVYVENAGTANSAQTHLSIALPPGLTLLGPPYYERGSGCTGVAELDCFLDYIQNGETTKVRFDVRASAAGTQAITARATADRDSDPSDNAATLTLEVVLPPPPVRAPAASKARQPAAVVSGRPVVGHLLTAVLQGAGAPTGWQWQIHRSGRWQNLTGATDRRLRVRRGYAGLRIRVRIALRARAAIYSHPSAPVGR